MYLNPSSSSSQRTLTSLVFTTYLDPTISSKLHPPINGFFQYFSHAPKLLSTLKLEVSVQDKNLSRICNWKGKSRGKLREIVQMIVGLQSLTFKCIFRVLFESLFTISQVMWDYIVCKEMRKALFKNIQAKSFVSHLRFGQVAK